jgi:hypothetical protein
VSDVVGSNRLYSQVATPSCAFASFNQDGEQAVSS